MMTLLLLPFSYQKTLCWTLPFLCCLQFCYELASCASTFVATATSGVDVLGDIENVDVVVVVVTVALDHYCSFNYYSEFPGRSAGKPFHAAAANAAAAGEERLVMDDASPVPFHQSGTRVRLFCSTPVPLHHHSQRDHRTFNSMITMIRGGGGVEKPKRKLLRHTTPRFSNQYDDEGDELDE
jgi:hypothetical protein